MKNVNDIIRENQWHLLKDLVSNKIPHHLFINWDERFKSELGEVYGEIKLYPGTDLVLLDISGGTLKYSKVNEDDTIFLGMGINDKTVEFNITKYDVQSIIIGVTSISNKLEVEDRPVDRKLKLKLVRSN